MTGPDSTVASVRSIACEVGSADDSAPAEMASSTAFGDRFWGQAGGPPGWVRELEGRATRDPRRRITIGKRGRKPASSEAAGQAFSLHGKEGVDGSSPSEGLKYLQIDYFCCLI